MISVKARLDESGRLVIPEEYRQALGLHAGDEVTLSLENGALRIFTPSQRIKYAQELLRPYLPQGRSLSDELIAERRLEAQNVSLGIAIQFIR